MPHAVVIGSGFSGLAAATCLASEGLDVTIVEKNNTAGGRARSFEADGYVFDMGPSWYWMPDVFEKYFNRFGKSTADYYKLTRLSPSYRIFYGKDDLLDIPADMDSLCQLFDKLEPGSSAKLLQFLQEGKYKYDIGVNNLVYKPGLSIGEFADSDLLKGVFKLHVFQSISSYIRKFFKEPRIIKLLEFPVLFLGATPEKTPALYTLMNYADMQLGTWYPMGGMYKIVDAMVSLAEAQGVKIQYNAPVEKIELHNGKATGVWIKDALLQSDYVVASADYNHVEQTLLPKAYRRYNQTYWDKRVMAPSSLLFYIGLNKRVNKLLHHTLFFDQDFALHAREIYEDKKWPTAPQFYVSCPSKTDPSVAPPGHENILILIPVAVGLSDDEATREKYYNLVITRLESILGEPIRKHVVFKRSYAHNDFIADYHAFKGNAYGLANTLLQTANLKPSIVNKKVNNLFYTGQLTVPGPGVPPSLISGQVVASELIKRNKKIKLTVHEGTLR